MIGGERPPESEARLVIGIMLALSLILVVTLSALTSIDVTIRSIIVIVWIGLMMKVLRRYRL